MGKNGSSKSFVKGISLLVLLALLLTLSSKIPNLTLFFESILGEDEYNSSSYDKGDLYSKEDQAEILQELAGFWVFDGKAGYNKDFSDRIELQKNGIIWRHEKYTLPFPYGKSGIIERASTAYLQPHAPEKSGNNHVANLRVIRETWMKDSDTCYGNYHYDLLAKVHRKDDTLIFDGRKYIPYKGELTEFFPPKAVDLVNDPLLAGCSGESNTMLQWQRDKIIAAIKSNEFIPAEVPHEQYELIRSYYFPYCIKELAIFSTGDQKQSISMNITVAPNGSVTKVKLGGTAIPSQSLQTRVKNEIKKWHLPARMDTTTIEFKGLL